MTPSLAPCLDITLPLIHRNQPALLLPLSSPPSLGSWLDSASSLVGPIIAAYLSLSPVLSPLTPSPKGSSLGSCRTTAMSPTCHAVSELQDLSNTAASPWTAVLSHSILHLPHPRFLIFQAPLSLYLLCEALLPSSPSASLDASWWNLLSAPPGPHDSPGTLRDSTCHICSPHLCYFKSLSGVDPVSPILCLCLQLLAPKFGGRSRAPPGFLLHNP